MSSAIRTFLNLPQRICTRHRISLLYSTPSRSFSQSPRTPNTPKPLSILEDDTAPIDLSEDNDLVNGVRPGTPPLHLRRPPPASTPAEWKAHKATLKERFPDGWSPPRKISRDAMDGLRQLHRLNPETFTTEVLAEKFRISPEAVRRILKSRWEPSKEKKEKLVKREKSLRERTKVERRGKEREDVLPFAKEYREESRAPVHRPKNDYLTLR